MDVYVYYSGKKVTVEVTSEQAKILQEMRREEWRLDAKYHYYCISLDAIDKLGNYIAICDLNPIESIISLEEKIEKENLILKLKQAITFLLPQQQELIAKIYFKGITQRQVALQEQVDESTISKRMTRIYKRLRKIIGQKPVN